MKNQVKKFSLKAINSINEKYKKYLLKRPQKKYTIEGISIKCKNSHSILLSIVSANTFRGFHKIDKKRKGAKDVVSDYFLKNQVNIKSELVKVNNRDALDKLSHKIALDIRGKLTNIKPCCLIAYNKTRKLIDLYFEHIVLLSEELTNAQRKRLLPLLFVPLDEQILVKMKPHLSSVVLPSKPTMSSVVCKEAYDKIQCDISSFCKSNKISAPIALDLLWRNRYKKNGSDFLELTLAATKK